MKKYKFAFDPWGLLLFLLIMLPNLFWFAVPAANDVLRRESVTPVSDAVASVCQVLFAAALCAVVNKERERLRLTPLIGASLFCEGSMPSGGRSITPAPPARLSSPC